MRSRRNVTKQNVMAMAHQLRFEDCVGPAMTIANSFVTQAHANPPRDDAWFAVTLRRYATTDKLQLRRAVASRCDGCCGLACSGLAWGVVLAGIGVVVEFAELAYCCHVGFRV